MTFIVEVRASSAAPWASFYKSRKELEALRTYGERCERYPNDYIRIVNGRGKVVSAHSPAAQPGC